MLADRTVTYAATSPYVLEFCRGRGLPFHALDGALTQDDANAIGYACLDASLAISKLIDAGRADGDAPLGMAIRPALNRALCAYLYKANLLDRLIADAQRTGAAIHCFGTAEDGAVAGFGVMPNRFSALLTVIGARLGLDHTEFLGREPTGAQQSGDFMRPSVWTRLITLLNAPIASLAYRVWRRGLRGRPIRLPMTRGPVLLLHRSNELIEELFLPLFRAGFEVRSFAVPNLGAAGPVRSDAVSSLDVQARLIAVVTTAVYDAWHQHGLEPGAAIAEAAKVVGARVAPVLAYGNSRAPMIRDAVRQAVDGASQNGRPVIFLSNAMTGPVDRLVRYEVERLGRRAIVAEHGVAPGLSPMHFAVGAREEPHWLGSTLLYTPAQKDLIAEVAGDSVAGSCAVVGAPNPIRRIGLRPIQRVAGRLALKARRRLIVWCTAFYPNNFQFLPHYWRDTPYHIIRRQVVDDVLGRLPDQVLLKLYPTYRYLDPDPLAGLVSLPANCQVQQFTDFRNMRAAADVVIVDGPGSIMSWAWSARVPFIFLETGMYVVSDAVREALEQAAFVIDCREPGWVEKFQAMLAMDHADLRRRFTEKTEAQQSIERRYLFGPENAKRSGVQYLRRVVADERHAA